jgi:hypothetical protein
MPYRSLRKINQDLLSEKLGNQGLTHVPIRALTGLDRMKDIITIRPKRPETEIERAANGNVNAWINELIENALGPKEVDWDAHFKKKRCPIDLDEVLRTRRRER